MGQNKARYTGILVMAAVLSILVFSLYVPSVGARGRLYNGTVGNGTQTGLVGSYGNNASVPLSSTIPASGIPNSTVVTTTVNTTTLATTAPTTIQSNSTIVPVSQTVPTAGSSNALLYGGIVIVIIIVLVIAYLVMKRKK